MSYEFPASVERDIQQYAQMEHISPSEAAIRLVTEALRERNRKVGSSEWITDEEIAAFERAFPALSLLDDVTDDQWDIVISGSRQMNREGFPDRG